MKSTYNPKIHHRQSIRLKGHDYAGGGLYFVTICAHREFKAITGGAPFMAMGGEMATRISPLQGLIEERMRVTAEMCTYMRWEASVLMPDHFHALIALEGGHASLGDVIGGFKAAVTRHIRQTRTGDILVAASSKYSLPRNALFPRNIRIWHRNYYETIVRAPEAERRIRQYIRMNPWRCVMELGTGLRGMGNPSLWHSDKLGVLCSRNGSPHDLIQQIPGAEAYLGGFHSPPEQAILRELLKRNANIIYCPAWGLGGALRPEIIEALEQNRMLVLEMKSRAGSLAAATERNRYVIEAADALWTPHVTRGGMLDRLLKEFHLR